MGDFTRAGVWMGVTWSLAVEEQFYLLFPLMVRFFSRRALLAILGICVLGAPLLRTALVMNGWGFEQVYPLLPCRADALALGVFAAIIVRSEDAKAWFKEHSRLLYACMLALFAATPTMLKWTNYRYVGTAGYSILDLAYFLFIVLLLVAPIPLMKRALRARWLGWLGMISYCVYLIHEPVREGLFLLFGLGDHPGITGLTTALVTVAALAATFAIAQLSWLVLEKRMIRRAHQRYQY
jgi:peptidoglycan/LPS O-acetylase OafA/YrhL